MGHDARGHPRGDLKDSTTCSPEPVDSATPNELRRQVDENRRLAGQLESDLRTVATRLERYRALKHPRPKCVGLSDSCRVALRAPRPTRQVSHPHLKPRRPPLREEVAELIDGFPRAHVDRFTCVGGGRQRSCGSRRRGTANWEFARSQALRQRECPTNPKTRGALEGGSSSEKANPTER